MADEPIQSDLSTLMTVVLEETVRLLPKGAIMTIMVTMPEGTPGMVEIVPKARTNYICNGDRDEMANAMIEVLKRWGKLP